MKNSEDFLLRKSLQKLIKIVNVDVHFNTKPVNIILNESEIRLHFEEMLGAAGFLEHSISQFYDIIKNHKTLPVEHKKFIIDQLKEKNISVQLKQLAVFLK